MSVVEERSYVEEARREKRAALEARGIPAFAYRYERSHTAGAALALYRDEMGEAGPRVRVAGRLDSLRSKGKTAFGHLEDPSGRIQVYFRQDVLNEAYDLVQGLLAHSKPVWLLLGVRREGAILYCAVEWARKGRAAPSYSVVEMRLDGSLVITSTASESAQAARAALDRVGGAQ